MSTKRKYPHHSKVSQNSKQFRSILVKKRKPFMLKLKSFKTHNSEIKVITGPKSRNNLDVKEQLPPKCLKLLNNKVPELKFKYRTEAVPMKLRAFPSSFWQQPNKLNLASPACVYCDTEDGPSEPEEQPEDFQQQNYQEIVGEPNIDLLFSLFRNVETEQRKALGHKNTHLNCRGRPKPTKKASKVIRDDDPYLTSSAAETLLPYIPFRCKKLQNLHNQVVRDEQVLAMVTLDRTDATLLSSIHSRNQKYSQILSELVVQL